MSLIKILLGRFYVYLFLLIPIWTVAQVESGDELDPKEMVLAKADPFIIRPSVFFFGRQEKVDSTTIGKKIESILVRAVSEINNGKAVLPPGVENITIIEEPRHWFIAFNSRGNGKVMIPKEDIFVWPVDPDWRNKEVYLDKDTLQVIDKPPGALAYNPNISILTGVSFDTSYKSLNKAEKYLKDIDFAGSQGEKKSIEEEAEGGTAEEAEGVKRKAPIKTGGE